MLIKKEDTLVSQTIREELANTITHAFGLVFSLIGSIYLVYIAFPKGLLYIISAAFYGGSLVLLYAISTLYHAISNRAKKILRLLDHISIYLLIAGTYMPISLLILKGTVGWTLFGVECTFCLMGITFKSIYGHRYAALSGAFYLIMGWLAIFAIKPLITSFPFSALMWLLSGGIFYSLGFLFFALDTKYHYFHAIWHLFVLAGSYAHFYLIYYYVISA